MNADARRYSDAMLKGYPGAALVLDGDNAVLASNAKGEAFDLLMKRNAIPALGEGLQEARASGELALREMMLDSGKGQIILEATIMPLDGIMDGESSGECLLMLRDLTMERNLRTALVESRQRYKDLVEVNSDFTWEVGHGGAFEFVSPKGALGYKADELVERQAADLVVSPDLYDPIPFVSDTPLENVEMWLTQRNGATACVLTSCVPLFDENHKWRATRGICRDVTDDRANEAALARARHREYLLSHIVFAIRDEIDPLNMLSAAAAATAEAVMAAGARIYRISDEIHFSVAAQYGEGDGIEGLEPRFASLEERAWAEQADVGDWKVLFAPTLYRHVINGVFAIWRHKDEPDWEDDYRLLLCDVANQLGIANEQISNHERILALSRTDSLTGLHNRRAFFEEDLPRRMNRLSRENQTAALFYVDLDNFKLVNDVHGHQAGDEVLVHLRQLLVENSRPRDVVARLGGDEFALWLDNMDEATAKLRAERLLQASEVLRKYSGSSDKPLGLSLGVALYDPANDEALEGLMARADAAMYAVKHAGKGGISFAPSPSAETGPDA